VDLLEIAGGAAVLSAGAAGAGYMARGAWRATRRLHRLSDDLLGDRESGKKGVVERLDGIDGTLVKFDTRLHGVEAQLSPNSGTSLHDKVDRTLAAVADSPPPRG